MRGALFRAAGIRDAGLRGRCLERLHQRKCVPLRFRVLVRLFVTQFVMSCGDSPPASRSNHSRFTPQERAARGPPQQHTMNAAASVLHRLAARSLSLALATGADLRRSATGAARWCRAGGGIAVRSRMASRRVPRQGTARDFRAPLRRGGSMHRDGGQGRARASRWGAARLCRRARQGRGTSTP